MEKPIALQLKNGTLREAKAEAPPIKFDSI